MIAMLALALVSQVYVEGRPPRDPMRMVRTGTAVLRGRVVDGVSGAAVARARVRLQGPGVSRPATTDASGGFEFAELPAGQFMISVDKSTYMSVRFPDPGRTLRGITRSLRLADGETREDTVIRIYHGAALTGRVLDSTGDPLEGVQVIALRAGNIGGRPQQRGSSSTNDLGDFRIARLDAGTYLLLTVPRRNAPEETSGEVPPQPLATYYPNTASLEQAQPIVLRRGQTVQGLDIVVAEGLPSVIAGMVVSRDGQPVSGNGYVAARLLSNDNAPTYHDGAGSGVRQGGAFQLSLAPGVYQLDAQVMPSPRDGTPPTPGDEMVGTLKVTAGEGRLDGATIVVGPAATASGRFVFEGAGAVPPGPGQFQGPLFTSTDGMSCRSGRVRVAPDWTFKAEGLSGTCIAAPPLGVGQWTLKAVWRDGDDITDRQVTFEPGQQIRNVQIVLTDRRSEMAFHVTDDSGAPTRDYVAIVFPVEKSRWTTGSRYLRTYMPAVFTAPPLAPGQGSRMPSPPPSFRRESYGGMPAGEYYVAAVDDIEADLAREPAILERLVRYATRVTVDEGAVAEVAVRRVRIEQALAER